MKKRKAWIAVCSVLFFTVFLLLSIGIRYDFTEKYIELIQGSNRSVLLLGSAANDTRLYKDIYSVSLKLETDSTGAYIYFKDGSYVSDGRVTRFLDGAVIISWSYITTNEGEVVEDEDEVKFDYCNYFPYGFYIIDGRQVYDYTDEYFRTDNFDFFDGGLREAKLNKIDEARFDYQE